VLAYRKSLVELERLQQTTLQNLNVTVLNAGGTGTTGTTGTTSTTSTASTTGSTTGTTTVR
jgi:hypothetical protein